MQQGATSNSVRYGTNFRLGGKRHCCSLALLGASYSFLPRSAGTATDIEDDELVCGSLGCRDHLQYCILCGLGQEEIRGSSGICQSVGLTFELDRP